jgi:hypothetical protein
MALINKNMLKEAFLFVRRYGISIDYLSSETASSLKKENYGKSRLGIRFHQFN